jgi:ribosome-binding protein aMBF1 (putative translation factor)
MVTATNKAEAAARRKRNQRAARKPKRIFARTGGRTTRETSPDERKLLAQIGRRIKILRARAGITAAEIADAIELTQSIQYRREAGAINFAVADLLKYAKVLKMKPADLLK